MPKIETEAAMPFSDAAVFELDVAFVCLGEGEPSASRECTRR